MPNQPSKTSNHAGTHAAATQACKSVVLSPGDFHFGGGHTRISTLLGSCVSITLWHPKKRVGGMCHYMMTTRERPAASDTNSALDGRYGGEAFEMFLLHVRAANTRASEYQAKLFGGANMFTGTPAGHMEIGARNIELGRQLLVANHITLMSEHVGGSGRRKLHFDLWTGDVWLAFPEGAGASIRSCHG